MKVRYACLCFRERKEKRGGTGGMAWGDKHKADEGNVKQYRCKSNSLLADLVAQYADA